MAPSGDPAAGCETQSAGRSPHSDTASPLCCESGRKRFTKGVARTDWSEK